MEKIEEAFENFLEKGNEVDEQAHKQFIALVNMNNVLENEDIFGDWLSELEAILYNNAKFGMAQLLGFKAKKINPNTQNQKGEEQIFKPSSNATKSNKQLDQIKGSADIFKSNTASAQKPKGSSISKGSTADHDEAFRLKVGHETVLDPLRLSYNTHLPRLDLEINQAKNTRELEIQDLYANVPQQNESSNYLFQRIDKIRAALTQRIEYFKETYFSKFLNEGESFVNDSDSADSTKAAEIRMVGRIVSTEKGFLNATNVRIEVNQKTAYDLVFEENFNFGNQLLFPNQIVMVSGLLNERDQLQVSSIRTRHYEDISIDNQMEKETNFPAKDAQLILVAAGPFSTTMSTLYSALDNVFSAVKKRKASVLVLLGPFVDIKNELLKDGQIFFNQQQLTFEKLQNSIFEKALSYFNGETHLIVVPSTRDILSTDSIPQSPLEIKVSQHANRIHLMSNPCYFELNGELSIQVANSDIAMITAQNSLINKQTPISQQSKLVFQELFNQDNLYSLYPMRNPRDSSQVMEIVKLPNINDFDVQRKQELEIFPKIVISPSSLPRFAFNVQNTVVINPSFVIREGTQPGGLAAITFFKNSSLPVHERIRVDFLSL